MPFQEAIRWSITGAWLVFLVYWLIKAFGVKRAVRRQSMAGRLLQFVGTATIIILLRYGQLWWGVLASRFVPPERGWAAAGAALTCAGVAIAVWARTILGGNWSGLVTVKEGHTLVRSGPYSIVRHPIYSGLLLALLGTALAIGQLSGLIAVGVMLLMFLVKSRTEERFMTEEFGIEYEDYRRQTRAIIPFVF